MHFRQLFSRRKARTVPTTKRSDSERKSQQQEIPQKKPSLLNPETVRTASNALEFALRTLSGITSGIPLGGALRGIINPLLEITGRIEQTSVNEKGLTKLAARIEYITPIVNDVAHTNQAIVQELQQELASITQDLNVASSKGKLNQFFNSADNASALEGHNTALDQLIAGSTFVTVNEVRKSLREIERSKLQESPSPEPPIVLGDVKVQGGSVAREAFPASVVRAARAESPNSRWTPASATESATSPAEQAAPAGRESKSAGRAGRGRVR
ncbi:hypothetical protein B0H14DRAFT_3173141 [Mycena olivaceomarginata]|nr:hypothetical protein B0H14DRAFT_3173141 [Mycena olivaceomarginata]